MLRETTSRGGTREEPVNPVLLHRVSPCFPWFLSFGNRTQNSRVAGARPNHQPIGGSDPNHQGVCVYYCSTFDKAVRVRGSDPGPCVFITAVCVFIAAVPLIKLFAWGEGESGRHGYERRRAVAGVD